MAAQTVGAPSVFKQGIKITRVPPETLVPSPRAYNPSIIEFDGKIIMAYRAHRLDQGGRCAIVLCELDKNWRASNNQWLDLPLTSGLDHHEDPRLFLWRKKLCLAYVETQFRQGHPYTCVIKYAVLRRQSLGRKIAWIVAETFRPIYGNNDGSHREKNWTPFVLNDRVHFIYSAQPIHEIIEVDGARVVTVHKIAIGPKWPWGPIHGGSSPIAMPNGDWLTVFHSSVNNVEPPFWRTYYSGAYTFKPFPPFEITGISHSPILTGSIEDWHAFDPRKEVADWKPAVTLAGGCIANGRGYYVAYGINDHASCIAEHADFALSDPQFATWKTRYFRTVNGSLPIRIYTLDLRPMWVQWKPAGRSIGGSGEGVLDVNDPRLAEILMRTEDVTEITEADFFHATTGRRPVALSATL